ncbi:unnamed protein product [Albugo candida]|uniref:Uncharacterized protein n=1 Tax=Albugo candida TaxID=65357 RepID=A0A024G934_9STRA|nr:unnamed protein product [Albugo candida]|eukprot:CCI42827.1 unnamed protein product [Albugo candida]
MILNNDFDLVEDKAEDVRRTATCFKPEIHMFCTRSLFGFSFYCQAAIFQVNQRDYSIPFFRLQHFLLHRLFLMKDAWNFAKTSSKAAYDLKKRFIHASKRRDKIGIITTSNGDRK